MIMINLGNTPLLMVCCLCKWCEQWLGKVNDHCQVFVLPDAQHACYLSV